MNLSRLAHLFILLTLLSYSACSQNTDAIPDEVIEATIIIDNNGAREYMVTSISGDGAFSDIDSPNPEIELTIGGRYTFINNSGANSHPLDFRNKDRAKLIGQSRNTGLFDDDPAVNILFDEDIITFTLTEQLASGLFDYVCAFHPGMNGSITVIEN